jgi:hypothetical protein
MSEHEPLPLQSCSPQRFVYAGAMKRLLRKTAFHIVNVTYKNGGFTNNLSAREWSIETTGDRIRLSFDLSPNQARGSEQSNSFFDASELEENFAGVEFFQLEKADWLVKGLEYALTEVTAAAQFDFELLFKDGTARIFPVWLNMDEYSLWFHTSPEPV